MYTKDLFCIDGVISDDDPDVFESNTDDALHLTYDVGHHSGLETDQIIIVCLPEEEDEIEKHVSCQFKK